MKLNDIRPNDFPDRKKWERVLVKFPEANSELLNIDSILNRDGNRGIIITEGQKNGYCVVGGNHTLARLVQLFDPDIEVNFTPEVEIRKWFPPNEFQEDVDRMVELLAKWGINTLTEFLKRCLEGDFHGFEVYT